MQTTKKYPPWICHTTVFFGFSAAYICLRLMSLVIWSPMDGLYLACALLIPHKYWPTLLLSNTASRIPWAYLCMPEFGLIGAIFYLLPPIAFFMLSAKFLQSRLPELTPGKINLIPMTGHRLKAFFAYAAIPTLVGNAYSTFLLILTFKAGDEWSEIIKWVPRLFLGGYLGCLTLTPIILLTHNTIYRADTWKVLTQRINGSRLLWEGVILGLAELGVLTALRSWIAQDIWRQMVILAPVAWMAMKYGWKGTAVGGAILSLCILLVMPFRYDAPDTTLALTSMAFAITILLPLGAKISELNDQEKQSKQESHAKTRFLAMLSHEIRTPMTGVMGMAELLQATPLTPTQREYVATMKHSGTLLLKLVNEALDLAQIEANQLKLETNIFDPHELMREVIQLDIGLAAAKGITLRLVTESIPPWVQGDVARVKQVLLNLINNALKFTERGSVVLASTTMENGLRFSISDTGPGISEVEQARLFQRFEQGNGPQRSSGNGLGLAICRELVAAMGGHIQLTSMLGRGSTFHVWLPLHAVEPPISYAADAITPPRPHIRTMRLLLVEDDAAVAAVIRGLLENQGHTVEHVSHGLTALAECSQTDFDAILLDLDLPGVDGFQLTRLLRQQEAKTNGRHLPVLAVSARSDGDEELRTREAGMDGFLRKPVSSEQLAQMLAKCVAEFNNPNIPSHSDQSKAQEIGTIL